MKRRVIVIVVLALVGATAYFLTRSPGQMVISGIVTTDQIIVGSEIQGRVQEVRVQEGDTVKKGDLLAVIQPAEWQADLDYYASLERQLGSQATQVQAELAYQELQTSNQITQAEANLSSSQALVAQAVADQENSKLMFERLERLYKTGVESAQSYDQARTGYSAVQARVEALRRQARAAESALAIARAGSQQIAARAAAVEASAHQLAGARAQKDKARTKLDRSEIRAPSDGIVNVRAALPGEVVSPGQAVVTLIDPDNLWVRADVEESFIDSVRLGDKMTVRLPSGALLQGTVFFRGVDAEYATQRDVNRSKRDIKTFEIRLRCDNSDRRLALGMTAYVPLEPRK